MKLNFRLFAVIVFGAVLGTQHAVAQDPGAGALKLLQETLVKSRSFKWTGTTGFLLGEEQKREFTGESVFHFDRDRLLMKRAFKRDDGSEQQFLTTFDGKTLCCIEPYDKVMYTRAGYNGVAIEGFVWQNPVAVLVAALHPRLSGQAFFNPSLTQLEEGLKQVFELQKPVSTKPVSGPFGPAVELEWNPAVSLNGEKKDNWKRTKSTVIDSLTGCPVKAVFEDAITGARDEFVVTELQAVKVGDVDASIPKSYELRGEIPKSGTKPAWVYTWKTTELDPNAKLEEGSLHPDPRTYGVNKVRDLDTRQTLVLPE